MTKLTEAKDIGTIVSAPNGRGDVLRLFKSVSARWSGKRVRVPKGFESDGFSCPRLLWPLLSPVMHPITLRAAIIHDYIYAGFLRDWSRKEADLLFHDLLVRDGFPSWKAYLAYAGVRLFGHLFWRQGGNDER